MIDLLAQRAQDLDRHKVLWPTGGPFHGDEIVQAGNDERNTLELDVDPTFCEVRIVESRIWDGEQVECAESRLQCEESRRSKGPCVERRHRRCVWGETATNGNKVAKDLGKALEVVPIAGVADVEVLCEER